MEVKSLACDPPHLPAAERSTSSDPAERLTRVDPQEHLVSTRSRGRFGSIDPDAELVAAAQRDPARFLALYDRYFPRVHGYVRVRIRDAATCEDVTSQVFTTALARIGTFRHGSAFRNGGTFGAWLFRIAQHTVHDAYRGQRAEPMAEDAIHALADAGPGPEEQTLTAERLRRLRALVGTLRPEQQHLLALRYGAGFSYEAIGQVVGKRAGAVRVSVHRILEDLRRRYSYDD